MIKIDKAKIHVILLSLGLLGFACGAATAAVRIEGQVQAGGGPLANSTVRSPTGEAMNALAVQSLRQTVNLTHARGQ